MKTYLFNMSYSLLVPFGIENIFKFKTVESNTFGNSDTSKAIKVFSLGYNFENATSRIVSFYIRSKIFTNTSIYNFNIRSVYNKGEILSTKIFTEKYSIFMNSKKTQVFNIRSRIERQTNISEKTFLLKSSIIKIKNKEFDFYLRNKIGYAGIITKNFNIPYILESGGIKYGVFTTDNTQGIIKTGTYSIDGITAGIGDISELLASEIINPILIYIVFCNGSFSNFRTGRFEIRESSKNTTITDNNISITLSGSQINISTKVDTSSPVSYKIIRGIL